MKPLRIGLLTYAMYGGGMETFLLHLGRHLAGQGLEVELVTTVKPGAWFELAAARGIRAAHVPGYVSATRLQAVRHAWRVGRWMRRRQYDAVLLNHALHAQASLGQLPDNVFAAPVFHIDHPDMYAVGCANAQAWNLAVAVSPRVQEAVQRRVPARPVQWIPYGVELPAQDRWAARAPLGNPVQAAFVGRLDHSQKGVFLLPDILKACRERGVDIHLAVAGEGPDGPQLAERFAASGLGDRVRFLGPLLRDQVYDLLLKAQVLIMPSFYEGLPVALLEALACGCVPVVSHLPGSTDAAVADSATGRLVPAGDIPGFATAIVDLVRNPGLWARLSTAAHRVAGERFSVAAMGRAYHQLILAGVAGEYPVPVSRRWRWPVDLRTLDFRGWDGFLDSSGLGGGGTGPHAARGVIAGQNEE